MNDYKINKLNVSVVRSRNVNKQKLIIIIVKICNIITTRVS